VLLRSLLRRVGNSPSTTLPPSSAAGPQCIDCQNPAYGIKRSRSILRAAGRRFADGLPRRRAAVNAPSHRLVRVVELKRTLSASARRSRVGAAKTADGPQLKLAMRLIRLGRKARPSRHLMRNPYRSIRPTQVNNSSKAIASSQTLEDGWVRASQSYGWTQTNRSALKAERHGPVGRLRDSRWAFSSACSPDGLDGAGRAGRFPVKS
jgi:hypothetical protein